MENLNAENRAQKTEITRLGRKIEEFNRDQLSSRREQIKTERIYIYLLASIAVFSLFIILFFLREKISTPAEVVPVAGLVLIIWGTIILVIVVDTTEQLTAAIGVLGTIGGYLFGQLQRRDPAPAAPPKKTQPVKSTP